MLKKLNHTIFFVFMLFYASIASADLRVIITNGINSAKPIGIVPFKYTGNAEGQYKIDDVIKSDLRFSGKFSPLETRKMPQMPQELNEVKPKEWSALGADVVLIGSIKQNETNATNYTITYQLIDTINNPGQILLKNQYSIDKEWLRYAAHTISDDIFEHLTGVKGVFRTKIAYVVKINKKNYTDELRVADYDGYNEITIHRSNQPLMSPTWSPDGKKIAFVTFEGGKSKLVLKHLDSGKLETLADFPQHNGAPAFSPDGSKLAFALSKDGSLNLYLMELNTKSLKQLTFGRNNDTEPTWMPDNKTLIYTSDQTGRPQLYTIDIDNAFSQRITWNGAQNQNAKVSADGSFAVLISTMNGAQNITRLDFDSNTYQTLTNTFIDETPSISPNGIMVIYSSTYGLKTVLNLVSTDGNFRARLPTTEGSIKFPTWSPFLINNNY